MENFWDYSVWGGFNLFAILLFALLLSHALKRCIPWLQASLIPTPVLGGAMILAISAIHKALTGTDFLDTAFFNHNGSSGLEIITYHALALGFIASTLKTSEQKHSKQRTVEIFNTGVTTVASYLIQAVFGLGITLIAAKLIQGLIPAAGVLLPFGYGQGPGQAMNYGSIYEVEHGFAGGKTFGLAIAAMGFVAASLGGVLHLYHLRKKGLIAVPTGKEESLDTEQVQEKNEIPMLMSVDKLTIQLGFIALSYFLANLLMMGLGTLLPGLKSVLYGFNFLLGVVAATAVKGVLGFLNRKNIVHRKYTSNFLMTRVSNFCFDIMVIASIAAIRLDILGKYWHILLILGVVGMIITYFYNYFVAKKLFAAYQQEQFVTMYGMLTGTASTGVMLLREIDPGFKTPAADNLVYQNFPAMVFGFPMMLLATLAPKEPVLTFIILVAFFVVMNVILFRDQIFKKKA